jgi:hypothetical protein
MQPDGAVAPGASRAVRRLSGLGGRVILCGGARSDVDEAAVRAALQAAGVLGDEAVALHVRDLFGHFVYIYCIVPMLI